MSLSPLLGFLHRFKDQARNVSFTSKATYNVYVQHSAHLGAEFDLQQQDTAKHEHLELQGIEIRKLRSV